MKTNCRNCMKIMGGLLVVPLLWGIAFPYCRSLFYEKDYKTVSLYIPKTKEKFYLISYSYPFSGLSNRIELSTCDWRLFKNEKKEFWYPKGTVGLEFSDSTQSFYFKVSNDTLYLSVYTAVNTPVQWKSKTKIVQIEESHFITEEGIHGWMYVNEEKRKERLERLGYTKFP